LNKLELIREVKDKCQLTREEASKVVEIFFGEMAIELFPSSFRCDCGQELGFFENPIRDMKKMSQIRRRRTYGCFLQRRSNRN